jgi:hypothetical protein
MKDETKKDILGYVLSTGGVVFCCTVIGGLMSLIINGSPHGERRALSSSGRIETIDDVNGDGNRDIIHTYTNLEGKTVRTFYLSRPEGDFQSEKLYKKTVNDKFQSGADEVIFELDESLGSYGKEEGRNKND